MKLYVRTGSEIESDSVDRLESSRRSAISESNKQLHQILLKLSKYLHDNMDRSILVADFIESLDKSRRKHCYVIKFERIDAYGVNYTQVESQSVAKQAVLEYLKEIGLDKYVVAAYPYANGGRGEAWFAVSVYFDKSISDIL